jgi:hypothetical protein
MRDAILAQFREIYDGSFTGEWGSGKSFIWKGKIGLILGCTGAWEEIGSEFGILGERFVLYRIADRGGLVQAERATRGSATQKEMEADLRQAMKALDEIPTDTEPEISYEDRMHISLLAETTARARTPVPRNYFTRIVTSMPEVEGPMRLAGQLSQLARGLALFRGRTTVVEDDLDVLNLMAFCSLPRERRRILEHLDFNGETVRDFANRMNVPASLVGRAFQDLTLLTLVEKQVRGFIPTAKYQNYFMLARSLHTPSQEPNGESPGDTE